MTVAVNSTRRSFNGNGATTVFNFPLQFFASADLLVILVDADGTENVQAITTHYTVSGAGNESGGNVTMLIAPASGKTLFIIHDPAIVQEHDYVTGDDFPADSHEAALDRLTIICQRLEERIDRCSSMPETSDEAPPTPANVLLAAEAVAEALLLVPDLEAAVAAAEAAAAEAVAIVIGVINATQIVFTPSGTIAAIDVGAALVELDSEKQAVSAKGAASGYASLDSSTKVPIAQIPTATAAQIRALTADKLIDTDGITTAAAYVAGGNVSGNVIPDFSTFINITCTLTGNVTLKFPTIDLTALVGRSGFMEFVEDGTGSRTLDVENSVGYKYSEGTEISIDTTASRKNGVAYHIRSTTEIWLSLPYKGVR